MRKRWLPEGLERRLGGGGRRTSAIKKGMAPSEARPNSCQIAIRWKRGNSRDSVTRRMACPEPVGALPSALSACDGGASVGARLSGRVGAK